jgi:hypothetical protein
MSSQLPRLSATNWAVLCVATSVLGSVLFVMIFTILTGSNPFAPYFTSSMLEALIYLIGFSLLINGLGAAAISSLFPIRKRMRSN